MTKVMAYDFSAVCSTGQTLYYNITDPVNHEVELTYPGTGGLIWEGYERPSGAITIPNHVVFQGTTYTVTAIGDYAFYLCENLTGRLIIPNTITTIGTFSFNETGFTGSLVIPNSVVSIDECAFWLCSELGPDITIGDNVAYLGDCCISHCYNCTGTLTIGKSLHECGNCPFYGLPVTKINYNAIDLSQFNINTSATPFYGLASASTLNIGRDVEHIRQRCFENFRCDTCNFNAPNYIVNEPNPTLPITITQVLNFGDEMTYINDMMCSFMGSIKVNIGNNVTTIGNGAFEYSDIIEVSLGNSVRIIEDFAFHNCGFLTSINFPEGLTEIGYSAFYSTGLTSAYLPESLTILGSWSFSDSGVQEISLPQSLDTIPDNAFANCHGLEEIVQFPTDVKYIGDYAFYACYPLNMMPVLPITLTYVGESAFDYCNNASGTLFIPALLTQFGNNAFLHCSNLDDIVVDASNPVFDSRNDCHALVETATNTLMIGCRNSIIDNSITTIRANAFLNCYLLESIVIGNGVTQIEGDAFNSCTGLEKVVCLSMTPPQVSPLAFFASSEDRRLIVPCGTKEAYANSDWNGHYMFDGNIEEDCGVYELSVIPPSGGNIELSVGEAGLGDEVLVTITPEPFMELSSIIAYNSEDSTQIIPIYLHRTVDTYSYIMYPFPVTIAATFVEYDEIGETNGKVCTSLYPNPTQGKIVIEGESLRHITITNTMGQIIQDTHLTVDKYEYDLSGENAGLYMVRVETIFGTQTQRVILTK